MCIVLYVHLQCIFRRYFDCLIIIGVELYFAFVLHYITDILQLFLSIVRLYLLTTFERCPVLQIDISCILT